MSTNLERVAMSVRFAEEKDLEKVLKIEELSFSDPWDLHNFKMTLKDIFLVYDDIDIVGFLIAVCCYQNIRATVMKMAVHPEHRRKGIATALLNEVLSILRKKDISEVCLDVAVIRHPAVALYRKLGFEVIQTIHMDSEDELFDDAFHIMKLML
jgi:ribosomal-protein-alanine N-acetyltransferase